MAGCWSPRPCLAGPICCGSEPSSASVRASLTSLLHLKPGCKDHPRELGGRQQGSGLVCMAQGVLYTDLRFAKGPGGRGTASQALEAGESHGILTPPPTANIITSLLPYLPPTALGMDEAESPHENITPELMPVGTAEERVRHSPGKWLAGMGMWEITVWAVCVASGHSLFPPWREEVPTLCHHVATMLSGDAQEVTEGDVWPLGVLQGAGPTGAVSLWGCWLSVCCCWWLLWCWGPSVSRDMWHWDMGTERGEVGLGATDYAREHGSRSVCPSCPKLQLVPCTSWLCPLAAVTHTPHLVLLSCSPALILPQPALLLPQPPPARSCPTPSAHFPVLPIHSLSVGSPTTLPIPCPAPLPLTLAAPSPCPISPCPVPRLAGDSPATGHIPGAGGRAWPLLTGGAGAGPEPGADAEGAGTSERGAAASMAGGQQQPAGAGQVGGRAGTCLTDPGCNPEGAEQRAGKAEC